MSSRPHIFDLDPASLRGIITEAGLPGFRTDQVLDWVYRHGVADPALMRNIAKRDREVLNATLRFTSCDVLSEQQASDGVRKLLGQWRDGVGDTSGGSVTPASPRLGPGNESLALPVSPARLVPDTTRQTECVMIPAEGEKSSRRTACISSQVGCPVGCRFCASGLGGLDQNLTAGQIVEQVWLLGGKSEQKTVGGGQWAVGSESDTGGHRDTPPDTRHPTAAAQRITNVVFMGMGEPLSNYANVVRAVRTLTSQWAFNLSSRKVTISTVGLPAQIRRLADERIPATLAISLHAPNDAIRRRLIPWAQYVTIEQLIDAGRHYFDRTGREVTIEYTLMRDVNDHPEHARELARVCRQLRSNVNLIRYNEVDSLPFGRPMDNDVLAFQKTLRQAGVNTHIRASRGRDIAAACGQLRHEAIAAGETPTSAGARR